MPCRVSITIALDVGGRADLGLLGVVPALGCEPRPIAPAAHYRHETVNRPLPPFSQSPPAPPLAPHHSPPRRATVAKLPPPGPPSPDDPTPAPACFAYAARAGACRVAARPRTGRAARTPAGAGAGLRRGRDAAAHGGSAVRYRGGRWLCVLRPRSLRCVVLFAAAALDIARLGRGRRRHAARVRLRDRCRLGQSDRPDRPGAGGGDTGAGRAPRRWRHRRRQSCHGAGAAGWPARPGGGARGGTANAEPAPAAAAPH